jgi:organic hydroperoxide reductase OsmC/OhrA
MQDLPHNYLVTASAQAESAVALSSNGLPDLVTGPPAEFGGPGDIWSPETLFVGSVSDCFILTFRAIARASKFSWSSLECVADGTLERVERSTKFTAIGIKASLHIPSDMDADKAKRLLEKAEANCLITQSMSATVHLETEVITEG